MAELKEVFEMVTKQTEPDQDSWKQQEERQRRTARNRRIGALAVVAAIIAAIALVFAVTRPTDQSSVFGGNPTGTTGTGTATPSSAAQPSGSVQSLSIVDVSSGTETAFTAPADASGFDVTLDGSMVTYTDLDENGNGYIQVFVMDADGSNRRQLTHGAPGLTPMGTPPQWSPDGSKIAYWVTLPAGGIELFVARVSDGVSTRVTHEPKDVYEGGWASDRSFVFSTSNPRSEYPLIARSIDVETGATTTIARDTSTPEASPDGTQIAFDSYFRPTGTAWLSLVNIDGTGRRKIEHVNYSGSYPKWSPDSTQIAFIDDAPDGGLGTYVYDLATGRARFVTSGTIESWIDDHHVLVS